MEMCAVETPETQMSSELRCHIEKEKFTYVAFTSPRWYASVFNAEAGFIKSYPLALPAMVACRF